VTSEEAKAIVDETQELIEFNWVADRVVLDGYYSALHIEAILVLMREKQQPEKVADGVG
jgi:hypothetical protein